MRDEEEIEEERDRAASATNKGTKWPGMTYEEGVEAALAWVLGDREESPLDE